jgi:hypothetical protein
VNEDVKKSFGIFAFYSLCLSHFKDCHSALQQAIDGRFILFGQKREISYRHELGE